MRKLLEMERQNPASMLVVNDENDLSDANRSSMSILGSLERLVETSFKPELASAAQQVMLAKRAFATAFADEVAAEDDDVGEDDKKIKLELETDEEPPPPRNAAAMKFLKYSELAKELSSSR